MSNAQAHEDHVPSTLPAPFNASSEFSTAPKGVDQITDTEATAKAKMEADLPASGSRFIESGLINSGTDGQDPLSADAANDDLISLLNNPIAPPLVLSELGPQKPEPLPSVLFVIPFPAPVNANRSKNTPPFLLYCPPRAMYKQPVKNEDGKRGKEKIIKRMVRKWQEEVAMGEEIKRGNIPNPTRFTKVRGGCIRVASTISKWLPSSCIETLSRLPPQQKIGKVTLIHPMFQQVDEFADAQGIDQPYEPTEDELRNDLGVLLRKTRKRVLMRAIISGMLLPISLGIDVFAPVFSFEINITYFAFQIYGLRKAKALIEGPPVKQSKRAKRSKKSKKNKSAEEANLLTNDEPSEVPNETGIIPQVEETFIMKPVSPPSFDPLLILLYKLCSEYDPVSFPPLTEGNEMENNLLANEEIPSEAASQTSLPLDLKKPGGEVTRELIRLFRETLPEEVTERHLLDEERLAEDLARYLKKASKEYIDSLSGRSDRKGLMFSYKAWRKKSAKKNAVEQEVNNVKKEQKRVERAEKRLAKQKLKEEKLKAKTDEAGAGSEGVQVPQVTHRSSDTDIVV